MRMVSRLVSTVALSLALSACGAPDQPTGPVETVGESHPGFARDMIALKASGLGEAERDVAVRAVLAKYGKVIPAPATLEREIEEIDAPLAVAAAEPVPIFARWKFVKITHMEFPFVLKMTATVPNGRTVSASTAIGGGAEFTDPFLVGYYQSGGAAGANAYPIKIVGFNDDRAANTLNASFSWTNNTGASQLVQILCFAFSPSTGGPMILTVTRPSGAGTITETKSLLNVSGIAKYNDEAGPFPGCVRTTGTRIRNEHSVGFSTDHSVLAVNASSLTGGVIRREETTLSLDRNLPSGYPNLFLGFIPWTGTPGDDETRYVASQQNLWLCPN
jgi:hypothetical protein